MQNITLTLRRAEVNEVVISSIIYSLVVCALLHGFLYILDRETYIKSIYNLSIFNVMPTTLLIIIATVVYSYSLYIESTIQYRKRKFYYNYEDKTYSKVFTITISVVFALIISLFLILLLNKFIHIKSAGTSNMRMKPIVIYTLRILSFLIIAFFVNFLFL